MKKQTIRVEKQCPKCGDITEDFDGFGCLYCEKCGYCTHASQTGVNKWTMKCNFCGKLFGPNHDVRIEKIHKK
jgi:hypothetical protein